MRNGLYENRAIFYYIPWYNMKNLKKLNIIVKISIIIYDVYIFNRVLELIFVDSIKKYKKCILEDKKLLVEKEQYVGRLGANGCCKSTLVRYTNVNKF